MNKKNTLNNPTYSHPFSTDENKNKPFDTKTFLSYQHTHRTNSNKNLF